MKKEFHAPKKKLRVGALGTTGMMGRHFLTILEQHPWFEVTALAASPRSAGKTYEGTVGDRWKLGIPTPERYKEIVIHNTSGAERMAREMDFVFLVVDMMKEKIRAIKGAYAKRETLVVSNNSVHRWTPSVPTVIPEVNPEHFEIVTTQRKRLGTERGFIAVKPSCSIQSYAPVFAVWKEFEPYEATVTTYRVISGAGEDFKDWPEMVDNIIPYTGGEEEKSKKEPLRIYGHIEDSHIESTTEPKISSQCIRVPVLSDHTAAAFVKFRKKPMKEQLLEKLAAFSGLPQEMKPLSAPQQFIRCMKEENCLQIVFDVNYEDDMGISVDCLREDTIYDWKFVGLPHNTLRGVVGGTVERAETPAAFGYTAVE